MVLKSQMFGYLTGKCKKQIQFKETHGEEQVIMLKMLKTCKLIMYSKCSTNFHWTILITLINQFVLLGHQTTLFTQPYTYYISRLKKVNGLCHCSVARICLVVKNRILLVIGKSVKPHYLKRFRMDTLPIHYYFNINVGMTSIIFQE